MRPLRGVRPSPWIIVAVAAIVAALSGTAIAGPQAISSVLTKPKVKKLAAKQANRVIAKRAPAIADQRIDQRVPGIVDQRIDQRAAGLTVAKAGNADALGGQAAAAYATKAELAQSTTGVGRVVSGSATVPASNATDHVPVLRVADLIDFELDCDPGQLNWMYTNRSAGVLHVSGSAISAAGALYNGADVGKGQSFALVGGNIGRFQTTVQATSADGRAVTLTAFIDAHSPSGCRASAQAVVSGP